MSARVWRGYAASIIDLVASYPQGLAIFNAAFYGRRMVVYGDRSDGEVRVSPDVLKSAVAALDELGQQAARSVRDVADDTDHAAQSLGEWSTGRAVGELMRWREREESEFGKELSSLADGLQKSAMHYEHADVASVADFGTIR